MSRRLISAAIACCAVLAVTSSPVRAFPGTGGGGGSGGTVEEVLVAYVAYHESGDGGGGGDGCSWEPTDGTLAIEDAGSVTWPRVEDGVTYRLWRRLCPDGWAYYEFPDIDADDLLPQLLERLKTRSLPSPSPAFELLDPVHNWAYVRVPVDFRAGGSWRVVSVTASIGPFWATVTAQPLALRFDPGDPASSGGATCGGDGPVAPYVAEVPGACSYTYVNASSTSPYDGYHFLTTMTIDWTISWTSSSGAGGPLEPFSTSATALLAVAEVKGLVTCTGSRPAEGGC